MNNINKKPLAGINKLGFAPQQWNSAKDSSQYTKWEMYSQVDCLIIEMAYQEKKVEVDLGNYIVNFNQMIQLNKNENKKQRFVKRGDQNYKDENIKRPGNERMMIDNGQQQEEIIRYQGKNRFKWNIDQFEYLIEEKQGNQPENQPWDKIYDEFQNDIIEESDESVEDNKDYIQQAKNKQTAYKQILKMIELSPEHLKVLYLNEYNNPLYNEKQSKIIYLQTMEGYLYKTVNKMFMGEFKNKNRMKRLAMFSVILWRSLRSVNNELNLDDINNKHLIRKPKFQYYRDNEVLVGVAQRGCHMSQDDIKAQEKYVGDFIKYYGFNSFSTDFNVANQFASHDLKEDKLPVIFEMEFGLGEWGYKLLTKEERYYNESEILFQESLEVRVEEIRYNDKPIKIQLSY